MGAQALSAQFRPPQNPANTFLLAMLPPMRSMKAATAKAMTKTAMVAALADKCQLKRKVCTKLIGSLTTIATKEVTGKTGTFSIPGLLKLKTRMKPATKAGKKEIFGKMMMVKAKPAKKIVKAFPLSALKKSI